MVVKLPVRLTSGNYADKGGENTMVKEPMSIDELKQMAATIRCDIIDMICTAEAGHPADRCLLQTSSRRSTFA